MSQAPQAENVYQAPGPAAPVAQAPAAPVYQTPAPVYQVPAPVVPAPVTPDRLAPVAPPRPDTGGNVTLTIKGPIHMAVQNDDEPQPVWTPAVHRVTTTK